MRLTPILAIALALRVLLLAALLVFVQDYRVFYAPDSASYIQLAQALLTKGRFTSHGPEILRTPGYPLFLILGTWWGHLELITIGLQIGLSCGTVYLVYRSAELLCGSRRPAAVAGLLAAVEPLSILYSVRLLSETLFTTLLALALYGLIRYAVRRSLLALGGGALAVAAAVYVRPILYYFPFVYTAILLIAGLIAAGRGRRLAALLPAGFFCLLAVGPLLPWQVRNVRETGYAGFSAAGDYNLWYYQAGATLAATRGVSTFAGPSDLGVGTPEDYFVLHPEQRGWVQARWFAYMSREGWSILRAHLPLYLTIQAKGMLRTLVLPGGGDYLRLFQVDVASDEPAAGAAPAPRAPPALARALYLALNLGLGAILALYLGSTVLTLIAARPIQPRALLPLIVCGLYLLILAGAGPASSRFRQPIMPILCVLAAPGLLQILGWLRRRRDILWMRDDVSGARRSWGRSAR